MVNNINDVGLFLGTTILFDVDTASNVEPGSDEDKQLKIKLYQAINNIIQSLNKKESGYYLAQEFVTGANFYNVDNDFNNLRPEYRTVVQFGALPATGTKQVAHGIAVTGRFVWTAIYAVASNPSDLTGIPVPYASATAVADNLEIYVDSTYVYIITGGTDYSGYTKTNVILKYLKE